MGRKQRSGSAETAGLVESLTHARFIWDAEVENARRLANRTTILITILAALLGIGVARGTAVPSSEISRVILSLMAIAITVGLVCLLRPRRRRGRPAHSSTLMLDPAEAPTHSERGSVTRVRLLALRGTVGATIDLSRRNARRQLDIDRAQFALLLAAGLLSWVWIDWLSSHPSS